MSMRPLHRLAANAWHFRTVSPAVLVLLILGTHALKFHSIRMYFSEVHSMLKALRHRANQEVGPGWTRWWTGLHSSWSP